MPRDNRHPSSEQTNRGAAIALAVAFGVGAIVFGGFYLGSHLVHSVDTAATTNTPNPQPVTP